MFKYNDGGRKAAGYKGTAGDCGARALAIAAAIPYKEAYTLLAEANKAAGGPKSARNGISAPLYTKTLAKLGWVKAKSPVFDGRKAYPADMPAGVVIARQAHHFVCVIDGVPQDTFDSSEKMVYFYYTKD